MSVPAVRFRLIPRDEGFFLLFNRAAENAAALAVVVQEVLVRLPDVEPLAEKALELENQGDEVLRDVNRRLDTAVMTPFDREDIHELMQSLDTAVDNMQAAIDLLRLHNIAEPIPEVAEFGDLLAKASEETVAAMAKLSHLRDLQGHLDQIDQIETRGDQLYREVTALLFSGADKAFVRPEVEGRDLVARDRARRLRAHGGHHHQHRPEAVIWAAFFNSIAFAIFGTAVASTIAKGVVQPDVFSIGVIFAGLVGAITWNVVTASPWPSGSSSSRPPPSVSATAPTTLKRRWASSWRCSSRPGR